MRLAVITASTTTEMYNDGALLFPALEAAGVDARPVPWGTRIDKSDFDAALIRTTWDYIDRRDEFIAWATDTASRVPLANPVGVLEWNTDKTYLRDLARTDVPTVPTTWVEPAALVPEITWERFVVKPAISAGGRNSASYDRDHVDQAIEHVHDITAGGITAMVQPHIESVDENGEVGVYVVGGEVTHAVHKSGILKTGVRHVADFRLAEEQQSTAADVTDELAEFARRTVAAVPKHLGQVLYARVDIVRDETGGPLLLELELVEPFLFLEHTPAAAPRVAAAVVAWMRRSGGL